MFTQSLPSAQKPLSRDEVISVLEHLPHSALGAPAASDLFDEFLINAPILHFDRAQRSEFATSRYKEVGVNKSSLQGESCKQMAYEAFHALSTHLEKNNQVVQGISPLAASGAVYDLCVVDEAQNASMQELLNALNRTKNKNVVYLGDSLQKGAIKKSSLPLLQPYLHQLDCPLYTHKLSATHRLKPGVARLANQVVALYSTLNEGLADNTAYSSISPASLAPGEQDDSLSVIDVDSNQPLHHLGANAKAAALILDEDDREEAKRLIKGQNVFLVNEAQGLEFASLLIYLSQKTLKQFIPLNKAMRDKHITHETMLSEKRHLPAEKGKADGPHLMLLSQFLVAISRASGDAWIYLDQLDKKETHQLNGFIPWLKATCSSPQGKHIQKEHSSLDDWLITINDYIKSGSALQAIDTLQQYFAMNLDDAQAYIHRPQKCSTVDALRQWIAERAQTSSSSSASSSFSTVVTVNSLNNNSKKSAVLAPAPVVVPKTVSSKASSKAAVAMKKPLTVADEEYLEQSLSRSLLEKSKVNVLQWILKKPNAALFMLHEMRSGTYFLKDALVKGWMSALQQVTLDDAEPLVQWIVQVELFERGGIKRGKVNECRSLLDETTLHRLVTTPQGISWLNHHWKILDGGKWLMPNLMANSTHHATSSFTFLCASGWVCITGQSLARF